MFAFQFRKWRYQCDFRLFRTQEGAHIFQLAGGAKVILMFYGEISIEIHNLPSPPACVSIFQLFEGAKFKWSLKCGVVKLIE